MNSILLLGHSIGYGCLSNTETIEKAASNLFKLISPEAGFHSRRSQSWIKRYVLTKVKPMESNEMRSHTIQ